MLSTSAITQLRLLIEKVSFPVFSASTRFMEMAKVKRTLDKGMTSYTFNFNKGLSLTPEQLLVTVPGQTPNDTDVSWDQKIIPVNQYILITRIPDTVDLDMPVDTYKETAQIHMQQMARTVDTVIQRAVRTDTRLQTAVASGLTNISTANVLFGNLANVRANKAAVTSTDIIGAKELAFVKTVLDSKYCLPFEDSVGSGSAGYVGVFHPSVVYDLRTEVSAGSFYDVSKYTNPTEILAGEIGQMNGIRVVQSNNIEWAADGSSSARVYPTYFFAKDAYGVVISQALTPYIVLPTPTDSDPAAQRGSVSHKVRFGAGALRVESNFRIESSATV